MEDKKKIEFIGKNEVLKNQLVLNVIRKTRNIASNFLLAFIFLLGISLIIYKKRISIPPKTRRIKINEIQAILIYFEIKKEMIIVAMIMDNNIDMG